MDALDAASIDLPGVDVRVLERCGSTNSVLLKEQRGSARPVLLATEEQTAGRGRRARRWHSPAGAGITFSLARCVQRPLRELASLSLVAGVAVARALRSLGAGSAALKWPNDLVVVGRGKLGGILVESRMQGTAAFVVLGVGINCCTVDGLEARLRRKIVFLDQLVQPLPERNRIIERIAAALLAALELFEREGFTALRRDWEALHAHAGQRLRVRLPDGSVLAGFAEGLEEDGGLRLRTPEGMRAVRTGQVLSVRAA